MENLIFFCAHPDDLIGCAGLTLLVRQKYQCHLVGFTSGEFFRAGEVYGKVADCRQKEDSAACAIAGITPHFMEIPQTEAFADREKCEFFARLFRELSPRAIFTHYPVDIHPDHVMTAAVAMKTRHQLGGNCELYFFEETFQTKSFLPAYTVDITPVMEEKLAMIDCYASQDPESLKRSQMMDDAFRGSRINVQYAERYAAFSPVRHGVLDEFTSGFGEVYSL